MYYKYNNIIIIHTGELQNTNTLYFAPHPLSPPSTNPFSQNLGFPNPSFFFFLPRGFMKSKICLHEISSDVQNIVLLWWNPLWKTILSTKTEELAMNFILCGCHYQTPSSIMWIRLVIQVYGPIIFCFKSQLSLCSGAGVCRSLWPI